MSFAEVCGRTPPRSARAEEGLIRLLYLDPGLAAGRELPKPEQFSSPLLGKVFGKIRENAALFGEIRKLV